VRRSMLSMLVLLVAGTVPAVLTAQSAPPPPPPPAPPPAPSPAAYKLRPAIGFGFFATLGSKWQLEGVEVGYVRRMERGLAAISVSGRIGTFINESVMIGGTQGIGFGATIAGRTRMKSIAQFGEEEHGTAIGFDMTLELTGYTTSNSPLSRTQWMAISALPAISLGTGDAAHFGIVIGPTAFLGDGKPVVRGMLSFRGEAPLARRERRP
jgi:hypothetical protein